MPVKGFSFILNGNRPNECYIEHWRGACNCSQLVYRALAGFCPSSTPHKLRDARLCGVLLCFVCRPRLAPPPQLSAPWFSDRERSMDREYRPCGETILGLPRSGPETPKAYRPIIQTRGPLP